MHLYNMNEILPSEPLVVHFGNEALAKSAWEALKKLFPDRRVFWWSGHNQLKGLECAVIYGDFTTRWKHQSIQALSLPWPEEPKLHTDGLPLNPWIPMTDLVDQKVVGKSMEEMFEWIAAMALLGKSVARCFIQGIDELEPTTGKSNRDSVTEEMADVYANMALIEERFALDTDAIMTRAKMKRDRQRVWHDMPGLCPHGVESGGEIACSICEPPERQFTMNYKVWCRIAESWGGGECINCPHKCAKGYPASFMSQAAVKPDKMAHEVQGLIADWGDKGDPLKRDTLTIDQMLDTLDARQVREVMQLGSTETTTWTAWGTEWTWNVQALQNWLTRTGRAADARDA